jgi:hypothetical protein
MTGGGAAVTDYTGDKVSLSISAPLSLNTWVGEAGERGNENADWRLTAYAVCLRVVP